MISQPLYTDNRGILRFKENDVILYLLHKSGITIEQVASLPFSNEDKIQFVQLIGIDIVAFEFLPFVTSDLFNAYMIMNSDSTSSEESRIRSLEIELSALRAMLREPISRLYDIDPDILK